MPNSDFTGGLCSMVAYMNYRDLTLVIPCLLTGWPSMRRRFWNSLQLTTFDLKSQMCELRTYLFMIQPDWKAWTRKSCLVYHSFI